MRVRVAHDLNQLVVLGRVDRGDRQHLELAAEVARGHAEAQGVAFVLIWIALALYTGDAVVARRRSLR